MGTTASHSPLLHITVEDAKLQQPHATATAVYVDVYRKIVKSQHFILMSNPTTFEENQ